MSKKRINKCMSWDEHWGCAISPMKRCESCGNADWHYEDNLIEDFKTYDSLRQSLWDICNEYVKKKHIRENEEFSDFMLMKDNTVALFFIDEEQNPCTTYTLVHIEDLKKLNYERDT